MRTLTAALALLLFVVDSSVAQDAAPPDAEAVLEPAKPSTEPSAPSEDSPPIVEPDPTAAPSVDLEKVAAEAEAAPPPPLKKMWSGQVDFGLNAASGNSELFNIRSGFGAKREGPRSDFKSSIIFNRASADGIETQNQVLSEARNEWKLDGSPWRLYLFGSAVYDEFQAWRVRVVSGGGLGYQFLDTETTKLQGRFGPGVSREIGGPRNEFIPEANLGVDFSYKISERQSFTSTVEYFPSFLDLNDFRVNSKANWECVIDPVRNISLRVGILDRYQSIPSGKKPNDLNYFTEIVWKF